MYEDDPNVQQLLAQLDETALPDVAPLLLPPILPCPKPLQDRAGAYLRCHDYWFGRILMFAVACCHSRFHLPFRACNALLFALNAAALAIGLFSVSSPLPVTLGTVLKRLDLDDRFHVYPVCRHCHSIFERNIPTNAVCPDCEDHLFRPVSRALFRQLTGRKAPLPRPVCAAPIESLSSLLTEFLSRPAIEDDLEDWKTRTKTPGKSTDIMDGDVWKTMKAPDGSLFFDPDDGSGELRIGVTVGLDW